MSSEPLGSGAARHALATLRECQDRVLEREGIPMLLALVSEIADTAPVPAAQQSDVRAEGMHLAETMDAYREALLPSSRDDDLGAVISVLQAVSYRDFAGVDHHLERADVEVPSRRVGS